MLFVLRPAAAALPYARAMAVARFLGHVHARTPGYSQARVKQMGEAFGVGGGEAARPAARQSSRFLCDSVAVRRALLGAADMDRRRIMQLKNDSIDRVLQSGESFILPTGHFSRQAFQILDDIERAIGLHPDQYLMDFLGTRRWDASAERWAM
jgi:lauroyl/myristoyl acyltransferase